MRLINLDPLSSLEFIGIPIAILQEEFLGVTVLKDIAVQSLGFFGFSYGINGGRPGCGFLRRGLRLRRRLNFILGFYRRFLAAKFNPLASFEFISVAVAILQEEFFGVSILKDITLQPLSQFSLSGGGQCGWRSLGFLGLGRGRGRLGCRAFKSPLGR